jgi:hypothetical protein
MSDGNWSVGLEERIFCLVRDNDGMLDSVDICHHIGERVDVVMEALSNDKRIERRHKFGVNYRYYVAVGDISKVEEG